MRCEVEVVAEPRTGKLVLGRDIDGCPRIKPTQGTSSPRTGAVFVQTQWMHVQKVARPSC